MAGFLFLGLKSSTYGNIYKKIQPSKSIFSPRNIFLKFGSFWRPDLSVQYLLGYTACIQKSTLYVVHLLRELRRDISYNPWLRMFDTRLHSCYYSGWGGGQLKTRPHARPPFDRVKNIKFADFLLYPFTWISREEICILLRRNLQYSFLKPNKFGELVTNSGNAY